MMQSDDLLTCVNCKMDYIGFSTIGNPHQNECVVDFASWIERMIGLAGPRKVAILEAGWPGSEKLNSSEAQQVQFIDETVRKQSRRRDVWRCLDGVC